MEPQIEDAILEEGATVGKYSLVKHATLKKNAKVWHYCNVYGTKEHPVSIGEETQVGSYTEIKPQVKIGVQCRIQSGVFIPEGVTIGNNVFIGPKVLFTNDKYPSAIKAQRKTWKLETTTVEDTAVLGARATIGPGITIGKGAIVGMGSVVVKDVPAYAVVVGNPAKKVGEVHDPKYREKFMELVGEE